MIEAVISDFGGVLTTPMLEAFATVQERIDVPLEAYGKAMQHSFEHDGEHPLFALERGEISEREFLLRLENGLADAAGLNVSLHGFGARLMAALRPNEALFERYRELQRDRGLRFALCTNNVREWESLWRPKLPIDEVFEVVVDSAFVGMRKPEPAIYALTLERLGLPGTACAFIDDLEVNVVAAQEAGMQGIVFRDTVSAVAELEALLNDA